MLTVSYVSANTFFLFTMHFLINLMYYFEKYNADQFFIKG